jgi:hypothetical protein
MALYGLDEAGAAKRLSAEARAAEVDRLLFNGPRHRASSDKELP